MEKDARGKAAEAIERRARQREAAALAQQALTPEAIEAEEQRQRENAALISGGNDDPESLAVAPSAHEVALDMLGIDRQALEERVTELVERNASLSDKLAEAVQPVLDASEETLETDPEMVAVGMSVFQWALAKSCDEDNEGGYELVLQVQVDEQPPGGFSCEITPQMLADWSAGEGLQGNRVGHKKFAAGLVEKAIEVGAYETGNALIHFLETIMEQSHVEAD